LAQSTTAETGRDPASERCTQYPAHPSRPDLLCRPVDVRWTNQFSDHGPTRERGPHLHELSRQQPVFTEPHSAIDRTKSASKQPGGRGGWGNVLSRRYRHAAEERRPHSRDSPTMGLLHIDVRQEPRDPALGNQHERPVRPLAGAPGVRKILRVHRRREIAVQTVSGGRHDGTRRAPR
jgi:hypothetical protein